MPARKVGLELNVIFVMMDILDSLARVLVLNLVSLMVNVPMVSMAQESVCLAEIPLLERIASSVGRTILGEMNVNSPAILPAWTEELVMMVLSDLVYA